MAAILKKNIGKPGQSISVVHTIAPYLSSPLHYHPEYELVYMKRGSGIRYLGDSVGQFLDGELVLVGKNVTQHWISEPSYYHPDSNKEIEGIVLNFATNCLGKEFYNLPEMSEVKQFTERITGAYRVHGQTHHKISQLLTQMITLDGSLKILKFIEVLITLSKSHELTPLTSKDFQLSRHHKDNRIETVLQYISENYLSKISQEKIAQLVAMNPAALSRLFKQKTNHTLQSYILDLRIKHATRLLAKTDMPVEMICYQSGFINLSNFNRIFKKAHKITPSQYRKNYR